MKPLWKIEQLLVAAGLVLSAGLCSGQVSSSRPASTQPATAPAPAERFISDEDFLKIGQEFDLDAFIKGLNPPTVEEIVKSLEPIPTREQILDDLEHPERRPKPPTLPEDVAKQVAEIQERIDELQRQGALGDDENAQHAALDEAIRLAERVVQLREQAGQSQEWHEVVDSRQQVATLKHLRTLPIAGRRELAAADAREAEVERLYLEGQYAQALAVAHSQMVIRQRLFPGDHPDLALSQDNLASVLKALGAQAEAGALSRDALAMRQRLFASDHPYVATSLNNLSSMLLARGSLAEAELLCREALAMYRRLFPPDHSLVVGSLNNLANLLQVRGALVEAEPLFRDILAIRQRLFSGDHPYVAMSLNNLAGVLMVRGALDEAEPLFRNALTMWRRLSAGDHWGVARGLNNVAYVLEARGALSEAEPLCREALAMYRRLSPGDLPEVALGLNNLAAVLRERGALAEAEPLFREALAMWQRLFPGDHPDVADSLSNLASLLEVKGEYHAAEPLFREVLAMRQHLFPGDHPDVAHSLNNLAAVFRDRGASGQAEPLIREALAMQRRLFGDVHPDVGHTLNGLARLLRDEGDHAAAEPLYREAFEMSERMRTQIVGGEQERAVFASKLQLSERSGAYASVLAQLNRDGEVLGILERGRARAALDLLERSGRDLVAEAQALGDAARSQSLRQAQEAEQQARIALNGAENLVAGRRKERDALEKRSDLAADERTRKLADYDEQIAVLLDEVKQKRQVLTQAGSAVLSELRGLFPVGQALTTEEILRGLEAGEAVLCFAWSGESVLVAVAAGGHTSAEIVAKGKDEAQHLGELAGKVRAALAEPPDKAPFDPTIARELLQALLPDPARARIASAKRLIVLPDGPLTGIPLESLIAVDSQSPLVEKAIVYAPSATVYLNRRASRPPGNEASRVGKPMALVVGDPVFDRERRERDYPESGVLIAAAVEGGNAAKAGLQRGDVLLRYDGKTLDEQTPLAKAIGAVSEAIKKGERPADRAIKVTYWRDGHETKVKLAPGKLGVQVQPGKAADGLRSMVLLEQVTRGGGASSTNACATEQVRLFGGVLPPLPGTRTEAEAIAALFKGTDARRHEGTEGSVGGSPAVKLLLGENATIGKLTEQSRGVRYLHLATHGLMGSADRPYDASLALTQPAEPTPEDIGFLRLQDLISKWGGRLNGCELVVLSACETQRGVRQGDSVMSLPLGFFFAGTPTVVASLWKVNDTATMLLMTRFYENLLGRFDAPRSVDGITYPSGKSLPKLAALRESKQWLRSLPAAEARKLLKAEHDADWARLLRGLDVGEKVAETQPSILAESRPFEHPYYWAAFVLIGSPE